MTTVSGTIRIGEAQATMAATGRRQRGSMLWFWALMLVSVVIMGLVGIALSIPAKANAGLGLFIGMMAGLVIYNRWSKVLIVWRYRKTLMARGVPPEVAIRWELTPEEIVYQAGALTTRAPWRAVSEIFPEKGWWIVMAQGTALFAADRFFADDVARRAFVADVLSHLSEEAKARSASAVKFVETTA